MIGWALAFRSRERKGIKQETRRTKKGFIKAANIPSCEDSGRRGSRSCDGIEHIHTVSPLGKNHLGKFAYEREMPNWLARMLIKGGQVCTDGVIPDLIWLAKRSSSIRYAYFCNSCVQHVSKLRLEGGFCGYRNIQSLISYIISTRSSGFQAFGNNLPSIFQIQDLIEKAWDLGFNSNGRLETGGIRGTRKYIGTPEAQALFNSISIPCLVKAFRRTRDGKSYQEVLREIEAYFEQACSTDQSKIRSTELPPIYLQHQGHSLTIVGFERNWKNESFLYVFDPSSRDPRAIKKYSRSDRLKNGGSKMESVIDVYRRGKRYLSKHDNFELLFLHKEPATA